jgi:hypothetical protein
MSRLVSRMYCVVMFFIFAALLACQGEEDPGTIRNIKAL